MVTSPEDVDAGDHADHHDQELRKRVYGPILRELLALPPMEPRVTDGHRDAGSGPGVAMDAGVADAGAIDAGTTVDAATARDAGSIVDAGFDAGIRTPGALPIDRCDGYWVPDRIFDGQVALTFDDGPNAATTPRVIATLRAHGAPATFFINGHTVDATTRPILSEIVADPTFILANHTRSHPATPFLDEMPIDRASAQIDDVEHILRAAGEAHRYFRFPFLRATCFSMRLVRDRGLIPVGINVDSADWCFAGGGGVCDWEDVPAPYREHGMIDFILHQLARTRGGVLLLHDYHEYTAAHLDALLTAIERAGYHFVALDDLATLPRLNGERFIGDACRDDGDCTFSPDARCHAAGFCTLPCAGHCPTRAGWAGTFCARSGECLGRWEPLNRHCADVPGTEPRQLFSHAGERAWACAPI